MIDLRVNVIRSACEDNSVSSGFFQILKRLLAFLPDILSALQKLFPGGRSGRSDFLLRDTECMEDIHQTIDKNFLACEREEGVHELDSGVLELLDVIFNVLSIGRDDRAVVMVDSSFEFVPFVGNTGVEDEAYTLIQQPHDVPVSEFCRIALRFARN